MPTRRRPRLLLALGSALALVLLAQPAALAAPVHPAARAALAAPAPPPLPSKDPFYTYTGSTPLARVPLGTVVKKRAVTVSVTAAQPSAEQVLYRTTDQLGHPSVTVATIIKPMNPLLGTKIVAYQTAYDALGSQCDPSYTLTGGNPSYALAQDEEKVMAGYAAAGYTLVVPDYEGTSLHWAAGQESGYGTLDGIRAAENYLGVSAATPVGMVGYSGGSIASEWASELAPSYARELHIVGVAEGGIPVDFAHNLNYVNGSKVWSAVIPAVLVSLSRAFGVNLAPYLSPYGLKVANQVHDQCITDFLGHYPGLTVQQLLKPQYQDFLKIPAFVMIINKLIMGTEPGHPAGPLLMAVGNADGTGDDVMIAGDVEALAHEYCQQGVAVVFTQYPGADHTEAAVPFEVSALAFLTARFAGTPPVNGCALIGKGNSLAPLPVPVSQSTAGNVSIPAGANTAAPLAATGRDEQPLLLIAVLLLGSGAGLLWVSRRTLRRS
ncbi:MAG: lipase family protein [Jatrophihabitantaceae bacterium]